MPTKQTASDVSWSFFPAVVERMGEEREKEKKGEVERWRDRGVYEGEEEEGKREGGQERVTDREGSTHEIEIECLGERTLTLVQQEDNESKCNLADSGPL